MKKIKIENEDIALIIREEFIRNGYNDFKVEDVDNDIFYEKDLLKITKLEIQEHKLTSIKGLEKLSNLKSLIIKSSNLESEIDTLKPDEVEEYLALRPEIRDCDIIEQLNSLEELIINDETGLRKINLEALTNLKKLHLKGNLNLEEIKGLENLKHLEEIKLHENPNLELKDLENLKHLEGLKELGLDFDMYPELVKENPELREKIEKEEISTYFETRNENLANEDMKELDSEAKLIIKRIVDFNDTTIEKVAAIYAYLVKGEITEKSIENSSIDTYDSEKDSVSNKESYNRDSSDIMHYMLRALGINSKVVNCNSKVNTQGVDTNLYHSVVRAYIGGDWYYFDPTLDGDLKDFKNFFKTKAEFEQNHDLSGMEYDIESPNIKCYTTFEISGILKMASDKTNYKENQSEVNKDQSSKTEDIINDYREDSENLNPSDIKDDKILKCRDTIDILEDKYKKGEISEETLNIALSELHIISTIPKKEIEEYLINLEEDQKEEKMMEEEKEGDSRGERLPSWYTDY